MYIAEVLSVALRGIFTNKLRSALTMLGIMVGIGSVIVLIAFSEGQKKEILKRFDEMGAGRMGVFLKKWGDGLTAPMNEQLTMGDIDAIKSGVSVMDHVAPLAQNSLTVRHNNISLTGLTVMASSPEFLQIENSKLAAGRSFTDDDNIQLNRVCVLGSSTKYNMFFETSAVGDYVFIGGKRFEIIGVLEGSGGIADHVREILQYCNKPTTGSVLFDRQPVTLIESCLAALKARQS